MEMVKYFGPFFNPSVSKQKSLTTIDTPSHFTASRITFFEILNSALHLVLFTGCCMPRGILQPP